jgi:hypothetical protein
LGTDGRCASNQAAPASNDGVAMNARWSASRARQPAPPLGQVADAEEVDAHDRHRIMRRTEPDAVEQAIDRVRERGERAVDRGSVSQIDGLE